ncbi:MAG: hypothetical protein JWM80_3749 [Cyanobacteria bacterium RYN_339]|nr:hypothetical protein [Cyanobacteria bacterium RYN_339]
MSSEYQSDLHYARLRAQRALLDAGQAPNKPVRKEKDRLYKQVNRRVQR